MTKDELKREIRRALLDGDRKRLSDLVEDYPRSVGVIISLTYDKDAEITWRAIDSIGRVVREVTERSYDAGRNIVRRLVWSVTEESGGIGWSSIEMLGEIVRHSPGRFDDIVPIIAGFFEEEIFRPSVLYALCRIGMERPGLLRRYDIERIIAEGLGDNEPLTRGYALITFGCLKEAMGLDAPPSAGRLTGDESEVQLYHDGEMVRWRIGELAKSILEARTGSAV